MNSKDPEEVLRGCKRHSKIFPVALELADLYKSGRSPKFLINHFAAKGHQITEGMISGYVNRNKLQRVEPKKFSASQTEKADRIQKAKVERLAEIEKANEEHAEEKRQITMADIQKRTAALVAYRKSHAEAMAREAELKKLTSPELVVDNGRHKTLLNMGRCRCWYPIGKPDTAANQLFCAEKTSGIMFCEEHSKIAYRPANEAKRYRA